MADSRAGATQSKVLVQTAVGQLGGHREPFKVDGQSAGSNAYPCLVLPPPQPLTLLLSAQQRKDAREARKNVSQLADIP